MRVLNYSQISVIEINLLFILLILNFIGSTVPDCGCNQLNRENENVAFKKTLSVDQQLSQEKVCNAYPRKSSKYIDYYGTDDVANNDAPKTNGAATTNDATTSTQDMSLIKGGTFIIGTNEPHFVVDHEAPEREVHINDFFIDKYEVSNEKFHKFVTNTNYKTQAEEFGDSFVFQMFLTATIKKQYEDSRVYDAPWWYKVKNITWRTPTGPDSSLKDFWKNPVVHVSWHDANAYCKWAGKRLPTETEFEVACRGGKKRKLFPWGNKLMPKEQHWLNIWQGDFPDHNTAEDGFIGTCDVTKFRQNDYDLYNIVGNVWEWTHDLWHKKETNEDVNAARVKKGGSYLCHKSYCYRYRCAARSQNTADSSADNLGFRCAKDSKK